MCGILSLTNSTLLIADMILLCTKNLYPIHGSHSPFHRKMCILLLVRCHCPPIWPTLPLNVTYIWIISSKLSLGSPPYTNSFCSMCESQVYRLLYSNNSLLVLCLQQICHNMILTKQPAIKTTWELKNCGLISGRDRTVVSWIQHPGCLQCLTRSCKAYQEIFSEG
jgi:hypothetical protein